MFHAQLLEANHLDEEVAMVWDGEDWSDIIDTFTDEEATTSDDDNVIDAADGSAAAAFTTDDRENGNEKMIAPENSSSDESTAMDAGDQRHESSSGFLNLPIGKVALSALISECFYYQLHSLPVWQALSFHYQRTALDPLLEEGALIMPARAYVMVAAVELVDLAGTFGKAGM
jgi:hypothetical protein